MLTLAIDSSTTTLTLGLVRDEVILATSYGPTENNQSEVLIPIIEDIMKTRNLKPVDIEKIAVAVGPGSYTGIRVGVAVAKSLGYALDIPVTGVSSLEVMAMAAESGDICIPMIDARRGTVFAGAYDHDGTIIIPDGHYKIEKLIDKLSVFSYDVTFVGDGATFHKEILLEKWPDAQIVSDFELGKSKTRALVNLAIGRPPQENIHTLVPNYLRKTEAEMKASV